jgi:hypothetical protein
MDGNGPNFFSHIKPVLSAFLLAFYLADASLFASAETGAAMIDIDRMTVGAPPAEFTFARKVHKANGPSPLIRRRPQGGPLNRPASIALTTGFRSRFPTAFRPPM